MKFTLQMFREHPANGLEPLLLPLTVELASLDEARVVFGNVAKHAGAPVHSIRLTSEDGATSERWFQLDGQWRTKRA